MKGSQVTIVKDGNLQNIDAEYLNQDDMVILQTGDVIPADLRLIEARGLETDEFDITGEILPVSKQVDHDATLYMGTTVLRGTGRGVVIATGDQTEYGKIIQQHWESEKPFEMSIVKARHLVLAGLFLILFMIPLSLSNANVYAWIILLLGSVMITLLQNDDLFHHFLRSRTVKKIQHMGVQIRDQRAIGVLSEIDVICFDKTGVLTRREINVKSIRFPDRRSGLKTTLAENRVDYLVKLACALCNDVSFIEKRDFANPVDKALIHFAEENGINVQEVLSKFERVYDLPFDSEKRYMTCGFKFDDKSVYYFTKGDPEIIMKKCHYYISGAGTQREIDSHFYTTIHADMNLAHSNGETTLALAYSFCGLGEKPGTYIFLCLVLLENSLRPEVQETIKRITKKGIKSLLLTGDKANVAIRVSEDSGITTKDSQACLTGRMIDKMKPEEVARQSSYCSVFARLTPSQKGMLIRILQKNGHGVAMVGDGANDAIALKVADVGVTYIEKSSPGARRLSKILINDLVDLANLLDFAYRLRDNLRCAKLIRTLIIAMIWLGFYFWVFYTKLF